GQNEAAGSGRRPPDGGHRADAAQRVAARRRLSRAGPADHRAQPGAYGPGRTARPRAVRDDRPLPTDAWVVTLAAAGRAHEARRRYSEGTAIPPRPDFSLPSSPRSGPWRPSPSATPPRPRRSSP